MTSELNEFLWQVPKAGFRWSRVRLFGKGGQRPEERPEWVLSDGNPVGQRYEVMECNPLALNTGLFRDFAAVALGREAILLFANEHGPLGIERIIYPEAGVTAVTHGEPEEEWLSQIDDMHRAVELWEKIDVNDAEFLDRHFGRQDPEGGRRGGWVYRRQPERAPAVSSWEFIDNDLALRARNAVIPARFLLHRWINKHLEGQVSPRVLYEPVSGRSVLRYVPGSLLGAMWLQFAQAVDGNKQYHRCKTCGRWFDLSAVKADKKVKSRERLRRMDRIFCSDRCKFKDYRERKKKALELHAAGVGRAEIAQQLQTEPATIAKWLPVRQRKKK
jgi:hypothetical protein